MGDGGGREDSAEAGGGEPEGGAGGTAPDRKEGIGRAPGGPSGSIGGMHGGQDGEESGAGPREDGPAPEPRAPDAGGGRAGAQRREEEGEGEEGRREDPNEAAGRKEPGGEAGDWGPDLAMPEPIPNPVIDSILGPSEIPDGGEGGEEGGVGGGRTYAYEDFIDERVLISRDAFGRKEMKIKVLEVSDEKAPTSWKLGDRVKVSKILVTVKHLETQQVEEGEFDIEAIEGELARERHYSSTNRWVPTADIKNGYVAGSRHTSLISDAVALDYITF